MNAPPLCVGRATFCEWKGNASYFDAAGRPSLAWTYARPLSGFERIAGYVAFYASKVEATVDGEAVQPQPGNFYGGWITSKVVGPFKGQPGTGWW
jgi:Domain of unknown function (DUF427)